jgi:penicillin amidase
LFAGGAPPGSAVAAPASNAGPAPVTRPLQRFAPRNEDGAAARYGEAWEPLTVHREEIAVRGRDAPEVLEVRQSRHGPLIDSYLIGVSEPTVVPGSFRHTYSLRWVGAEHLIEPSTVHRVDVAGTWEEFRRAVQGWVCPGQNMVYADVDGTIGYQATGLYPIRRAGDGSVPVPGWTDRFEWDGWIPFDELPRSLNPEHGYICTANNRIHDETYPYTITRDFLPPYRARRIVEMLTERPAHDRGSFAAIQRDTTSLSARRIVPELARVEPRTDRQKMALGLLGEWDHSLDVDSAPAALYEVWIKHLATRVLRPALDDEALFTHFYARRQWTNAFHHLVLPQLLAYPTARWFGRDGTEARDEVLLAALDDALDELTGALGDDVSGWRWGALHRARFAGRRCAGKGRLAARPAGRPLPASNHRRRRARRGVGADVDRHRGSLPRQREVGSGRCARPGSGPDRPGAGDDRCSARRRTP